MGTSDINTPESGEPESELPGPVQLPVEPVLDLHTFRPNEIKDLLTEYLAACRQRGVLEVRIIHGRGIGNLQRTVAAILQRLPDVVSWCPASEYYGGPGATIVKLRPLT